MIRALIKAISITAIALLPIASNAQSNEEIQQIREKLKQTFTNYKITNIRPSPIPGIVEIHAGPRIHYFAPEQELLIFGQIWTSDGVNLTEQAKQDSFAEKRGMLPMDSAILVQEGDIPIIEIVNPDCGYCQRYEKWIAQLTDVYSIERKVIFLEANMFPNSRAKMLSVLCADDKAEAYHQMVNGDQAITGSCEAGEKILAAHQEITNTLGVQGTPTFLLPDGKVITGFKQSELEFYFINSASKVQED